MRPKQIPQRLILSEQGVALVATIVLEMGYVWYPTGQVEAGIDGHVELRDVTTGEALNSVFSVQVKATAQPFARETNTGFEFTCNERDLDHWLRGNLPVVLVVTRPASREAYWVDVKEYFRHPARRAARKVYFDKRENRFAADCREVLFRIATHRDAGIYLTPLPKKECLVSNLLRVASLPGRLYVAPTQCQTRRDVWAMARQDGVSLGDEWILRGRQLVSFRNLARHEWAVVCDQGAVEEHATREWSQTDEADRYREFVELLNRSLAELVRPDLEYHRRLEFFYFRPTPDLEAREVNYRGLELPTDRVVFKGYPDTRDGSIKYYRHSAFHGQFERYDGRWFLEITPTYHYTTDGYTLRGGYSRLLKRIKEIEGHKDVRSQVMMWATFLSPHADMFSDEPYPFLGFGDLETFEVDRGIDDERWNLNRTQRDEIKQDIDSADDMGPSPRGPGMLPLFSQ